MPGIVVSKNHSLHERLFNLSLAGLQAPSSRPCSTRAGRRSIYSPIRSVEKPEATDMTGVARQGRAGHDALIATWTDTPQEHHDRTRIDRPSGRPYVCRPDGLRTGSPPFPPPRLIRPTVRLLLRS